MKFYFKITLLTLIISVMLPSRAFSIHLGYIPKSIPKILPQDVKNFKKLTVKDCRKALETEPENSNFHACVAADAIKHKQWDEAVKHFEKAIQFSNGQENSGFYISLAQAYLNLKNNPKASEVIQKALSIAPESITLHYWLASFYEMEKQLEKAEKEYEKVASFQPNERIPIELFFRAHGFIEAKKEEGFELAEKELQRFLKIVPDHLKGMILLGYVHIKLKKLDQAVDILKKAEAIKPDHLSIQLLLAQANFMTGEMDMAIGHGKKVIEALPDHLTANFLVGTAYLKKGDKENGIEYLNKVEIEQKELKSAQIQLGNDYLSKGKLNEAAEVLKDLAEQNPRDISIQISLIKFMIYTRNSKEAIKQSDKILKKDPKNLLVRYMKAVAFLTTKEPKKAEELLKAIIHDEEKFYPAYVLLIRLFADQEKFNFALQFADELIEKLPGHPVGHMIKGDLAYARGERAFALNAYKKVVEINPDSTLTWMKILQLYLEEKSFIEAERIADQLIKKHPRFPLAYVKKGIVNMLKKKEREAKDSFQKAIAIDENYFKAHNYLGFIESKSAIKEAIHHYEISLKIFPNQPAIYFQLAGLYIRSGNIEKGLATARKWGHLYPDQGGAYELMGIIYTADNKVDEAVTYFKKAILKEPKNPSPYLKLGTLYAKKKDIKGAVLMYEQALKNIPDHPVFLNNLAWNYAEAGRIEDAIVLAKKADKKAPGNWAIKETLGLSYYKKGDYTEAIKKFKEAIAINEKNPILQYYIGKAYLASGKKKKALKHLTKAGSYSEPFPQKIEIKELINSLR